MRLALVLPPLTQLNTPYPSTGWLARSLRDGDVHVTQRDFGIELILKIFSRSGLEEVFDAVAARGEAEGLPEPAWAALAWRARHLALVEPVVAFLQGRDRSLGPRLVAPGFLPAGPRLDAATPAGFGPMSVEDRARYRATLYLEDLADLVTAAVDEGFGLARYQAQLATGPVSFDPLAARLAGRTLLDGWLDALTDSLLAGETRPDVVGLSVPFPGTLYGALRIGARLRAAGVPVLLGGGYVNTELRAPSEPRLWGCIDALCLDDGEGPLRAMLDFLAGDGDRRHRTWTAEGYHAAAPLRIPVPALPWYGDLPLDRYLSVLDATNPAHRLWSDGRWNKAMLAHGCYWKRCAFCDVNLDYIARYEPSRVPEMVDGMVELAAATGVRGFHLVDEAAPPRLLRDLALQILARGETFTFWGNIRFEKAFTPDLARLLAAAGLVAVTGGLEVASDRLLQAMDKGIRVEQAVRAAAAFRDAGVMVHAYLMYGFPGQTAQETVDSLEVVRQLFAAGLLRSAFWHRFVLTRHSAVYADPARFAVRFSPPQHAFATNDLPHEDLGGADHDAFDQPLVASLAAWMRGEDLDAPLSRWLGPGAPPSQEPADRVARALLRPPPLAEGDRLIWLGGEPLEGDRSLLLQGPGGLHELRGGERVLGWLAELLDAARPGQEPLTLREAVASYPGEPARLEKLLARVRRLGLVGI